MRSPARLVLKQPNRANSLISAKIKPVERAARDSHQVSGLHFDRHHWPSWRMNVKQSSPRNDVPHFVLIMRVLDVELRQHRVQPGSIRVYVNHVRRYVSAPSLQFFNLWPIRAQHLLRRRVLRQVRGRLPAFVLDADSGQVLAYLILFANRSLFLRNSQHSHGNLSCSSRSNAYAVCAAPERPRTSIKNSRISTCRLASPRLSPQV